MKKNRENLLTGQEFRQILQDVVNKTNLNKSDQSDEREKKPVSHWQQHQHDLFHPQNIFNRTRNFPSCPSSANAARLEAEKILFGDNDSIANLNDESKHREAAKLLLLSQSNTFQHQVLANYGKKLMRRSHNVHLKKVGGNHENYDEDEEDFDEQQKKQMLFDSFDKTDVLDKMSSLPPNWTVVQIAGHDPLVTRFKKTKASLNVNPALTIVRLSGGQVRVGRCPGSAADNCLPFLKEFDKILKDHVHVNKNPKPDLVAYRNKRKDHNERLQRLLESIEDSWLGFEKASMLGLLQDPSAKDDVAKAIKEHFKMELSPAQYEYLTTLLSATHVLSPEQLFQGIVLAFPNLPKENLMKTVTLIKDKLEHLSKSSREPVILILDPEVQSLPWESLPCMTKCCQATSRSASLPYLYSLWSAHAANNSSVVTSGMAQDNVFYVLNPDQNLKGTEERIGDAIKKWENWEGIVGQVPKKQQIQSALQGKDAYMYIGHGSGCKYISMSEVEKLRVRAVPMLLGCSSGKMERKGRSMDPLGVVQSYMIAASPALLGFLWPITDVDLDKWTISFLEHWLTEGGQEELLQAVADRRQHFDHFLNGAALVVYGLPLKAKKP